MKTKMKLKKAARLKIEITSEEKSEKEIKEEPLTIENLSLFDDFKES